MPIENCKKCKFHYSSPYPTEDSFERPEYWWCTNPEIEHENNALSESGENTRKFIKKDMNFKSLSYVAGYVEWNDKTPIPEFCPLPEINE